ncbi:motility protein A [[Clostridium] polysaccharolyticum]|jgi:chemotaxis protein MotA|uniref:Chemotaxis protein MotA n=1 Tax=[Clostridium] polysaccharolyticum TaxID=29364 RepID=A0A1H9Y2F7_9FIRM|nr:motility protein A [[Clostridium] polysaccharolyticum]SES62840.1 chemotaxis protein MotA [[Clostridium] polysaccharolyticum]
MDLASILGIVLSFTLMIFGMVFGDDGIDFGKTATFIHVPSMLITFGGSFMAILAQSESLGAFAGSLKSITLIMKVTLASESEIIHKIIDLSNVARKEGLLALEEAANEVEDEFLKKGILLIVDGTDPELVRSILESELTAIEDRHGSTIGFWENIASMGPAWGMIGTLIGLINMLKELDDPSNIGAPMSTALITTFYGSVLANWIATPVALKLKAKSAKEIRMKEVIVEGLLSIQAGENPRVIEEKLKSFLAPAERASFSEGQEGGEA